MTLYIAPLTADQREAWQPLARGYMTFYERTLPDADYDITWDRLLRNDGIHGLAATLDGRVVGIAHYFFHTAIWVPAVCYLQDLFVDESVRGKGIARALIAAVADEARKQHAQRLYWNTQEHNKTARLLYDKVAKFNGFIRYDIMF
jgi:GNAT superfamily N-acetyltransferase